MGLKMMAVRTGKVFVGEAGGVEQKARGIGRFWVLELCGTLPLKWRWYEQFDRHQAGKMAVPFMRRHFAWTGLSALFPARQNPDGRTGHLPVHIVRRGRRGFGGDTV